MMVGKEKVSTQLKDIFVGEYENIKNYLIEELAREAKRTHEARGEHFEVMEKHFESIVGKVVSFKDQTYCLELERFLKEEKILP